MKDVCYLKNYRFWTMGGAIILCTQCILRQWRQMVALSELLVLISIAFGFLLKHNSENKILIRYHIVWLLATREAMQDFPSNTKKRKEWEDACGQIKLPKVPLLFSPLLVLMPLSFLVDHSCWKSLQTAKTRNARCHLLGWKRCDR